MPKQRARVLVEECHCLDVNRLNREGTLVAGATVNLRWGDGHTETLYVWRDPENHYRAGGFNLEGSATIWLAWTACNYGGERPWLRCPCCSRRCTKLLDYYDHGFRCRRCYRAGYAIENEAPEWRLRRRIKNLEGRLAEDLERPKGMHQTTYQRLCDVITNLETAADALFVEGLSRRWPEFRFS